MRCKSKQKEIKEILVGMETTTETNASNLHSVAANPRCNTFFNLRPNKHIRTLLRRDVLRWRAAETKILRPIHTLYSRDLRNYGIHGHSLKANNKRFVENLSVVHALSSGRFKWEVVESTLVLWAIEQLRKISRTGNDMSWNEDAQLKRGIFDEFEFLTDRACLQLFRLNNIVLPKVDGFAGIGVSHTTQSRYEMDLLLNPTVVLCRQSSVSGWVGLEVILRRYSLHLSKIF